MGEQAPVDGRPGQLRSFLLRLWSVVESLLGSVRCWWIVGLCYAAIFAWGARYSMNPDGLSYLDMASAFLAGGPSKLVNGLWSPGYPALIAAAFFLFRPSPSHEFQLVHLINLFLFALALWAFSVFVRAWSAVSYRHEAASENKQRCFTAFAYCTFLWFTLRLVGVENVTPDLGVVAAVFLAAAIGCRLFLDGSSWRRYAALGVVLGLGYCFKAIMLPLGVALLVILFFTLPRSGDISSGNINSSGISRPKLLLSLSFSLLVLLLVAAPQIAGLSVQAGRLSFGDAGRLNYLWHVNKLSWPVVSGGQSDARVEHPLRILSTTPPTWDFSGAVKSTYPMGYDSSYWWAGVKPRFNIRQQVAELKESLLAYKETALLEAIPFLSGLMVLGVLSLYRKSYRAAPRILWLAAWTLAACLMYALVHTEPRYVSPFLALFFVAAYSALMLRVDTQVAAAVCSTLLLCLMIPVTIHWANVVAGIAEDLVHPSVPGYQAAGRGLHDLGLKPGDRIAIVGDADNCYFARYDRLLVIAQVPDAQTFWRLSPPELKSFSERLASIGAKAIVVSNRPDFAPPADWKDVEGSTDAGRISVLLLAPRGAAPETSPETSGSR